MNEDMITKLAKAIVDETFLGHWKFYATVLLLVFIATYVVAFVAGFAKERSRISAIKSGFKDIKRQLSETTFAEEKARTSAIKSDLDEIKRQLGETTRVTAQIQNDIEHEVWRKKAVESVKREKLEEYLILFHMAIDAQRFEILNTFHDRNEKYDANAWYKADIVQKLYLPEIDDAHEYFGKMMNDGFVFIHDGREHKAQKEMKGQSPALSRELRERQGKLMDGVDKTKLHVISACIDLAKSLNS